MILPKSSEGVCWEVRAGLEVCGSSEFIVKIPNEGNLELKESSKISVSWSPDDIRALDF